ncbi:MAG: hypothetical protein IJM59_00880, partial [Proteobacteria bacterium]|nr:hypothetical protein [Pseudomonadota bacterium]
SIAPKTKKVCSFEVFGALRDHMGLPLHRDVRQNVSQPVWLVSIAPKTKKAHSALCIMHQFSIQHYALSIQHSASIKSKSSRILF